MMLAITAFLLVNSAGAAVPDPAFYRALTQRIRTQQNFIVRLPGRSTLAFNYQLRFGAPKLPEPSLLDMPQIGLPTEFMPGPVASGSTELVVRDPEMFLLGNVIQLSDGRGSWESRVSGITLSPPRVRTSSPAPRAFDARAQLRISESGGSFSEIGLISGKIGPVSAGATSLEISRAADLRAGDRIRITEASASEVVEVAGVATPDSRVRIGAPLGRTYRAAAFELVSIRVEGTRPARFAREFWDRIWLADPGLPGGSWLQFGEEVLPLTCIVVHGQDNRFSGKGTPLLPDFVIRVTLVANDFSCTGPINPGWPFNGGRKEMWDTFLRFRVTDPTIMLPVDAEVRYQWNEFQATVQDGPIP